MEQEWDFQGCTLALLSETTWVKNLENCSATGSDYHPGMSETTTAQQLEEPTEETKALAWVCQEHM